MNKTINLTYAAVNGRKVTAPLEAWIVAILHTMDNRSREAVLSSIEQMSGAAALRTTKVITSLHMPGMNNG